MFSKRRARRFPHIFHRPWKTNRTAACSGESSVVLQAPGHLRICLQPGGLGPVTCRYAEIRITQKYRWGRGIFHFLNSLESTSYGYNSASLVLVKHLG